MQINNENEPLICRKIIRSGVVVATLHPTVGPLFWQFEDESDCNAPDYYGITDYLRSATVFRSGYYNGNSFLHFQSRCVNDIVDDYSWQIAELATKADCTPQEFVDWLDNAVWVECSAPLKIYFLTDFNGFIGYRLEHSENVKDALHWSREDLVDKEDLNVELASSWGHFVPLSQALHVKPIELKPSKINHALEADCALTLYRLGLQRHRYWSQPESGIPSCNGNLREAAWIHAARAGVEYVRSGEVLPVSGHITTFPELFERFNMAAALERNEECSRKFFEEMNTGEITKT